MLGSRKREDTTHGYKTRGGGIHYDREHWGKLYREGGKEKGGGRGKRETLAGETEGEGMKQNALLLSHLIRNEDIQ